MTRRQNSFKYKGQMHLSMLQISSNRDATTSAALGWSCINNRKYQTTLISHSRTSRTSRHISKLEPSTNKLFISHNKKMKDLFAGSTEATSDGSIFKAERNTTSQAQVEIVKSRITKVDIVPQTSVKRSDCELC